VKVSKLLLKLSISVSFCCREFFISFTTISLAALASCISLTTLAFSLSCSSSPCLTSSSCAASSATKLCCTESLMLLRSSMAALASLTSSPSSSFSLSRRSTVSLRSVTSSSAVLALSSATEPCTCSCRPATWASSCPTVAWAVARLACSPGTCSWPCTASLAWASSAPWWSAQARHSSTACW